MSITVHQSRYTITTDQDCLDLVAIHAFLTRSYWSPGVSIEIVERSIQNSLSFGVFYGQEQVGFGRIVTDKATFAYLADVYIVESHRGRGLCKWLMKVILGHEELQNLRRFLLATKDAHGLYEQFGFQELANPERMMEIRRLG